MGRATAWMALLATLAVAPSAAAWSTGPPSDRVQLCGGPGACLDCHSNAGCLSSSARSEFLLAGPPEAPLPATYTPRQGYRLLLRVVEGNARRCSDRPPCGLSGVTCVFGFQVAAALEDSPPPCNVAAPRQAGCFTAGTSTQLRCGAAGSGACGAGCSKLDFLEHACGVEPDFPMGLTKTWTFDWQAPAPGSGRVHFYHAVNSANGDGAPSCDQPVFGEAAMDEAAAAQCDLLRGSVASLSPPPDRTAKETLLFGDGTSCAPKRVPGSVDVPSFTATPSQVLAQPLASGDPFIVYEVDCPCSGTLRLFKEPGTPPLDRMRAVFQP